MRITGLSTIYPSFVMQGMANEISHEENLELARVSWSVWNSNAVTESQHKFGGTEAYYLSSKRSNMFAEHKTNPVVMKLARVADSMARAYLRQVYRYECTDPIDMMAEPFCQNAETGTHGIAPHTHTLKPLLVTYYPIANVRRRDDARSGCCGLNGEANFYDPTNTGKRVWPNKNPDFFIGSSFRVEIKEGMLLAFEGHIPHDSAQFEGDERVCIPVICYPKLPNKNLGCTLEDLL